MSHWIASRASQVGVMRAIMLLNPARGSRYATKLPSICTACHAGPCHYSQVVRTIPSKMHIQNFNSRKSRKNFILNMLNDIWQLCCMLSNCHHSTTIRSIRLTACVCLILAEPPLAIKIDQLFYLNSESVSFIRRFQFLWLTCIYEHQRQHQRQWNDDLMINWSEYVYPVLVYINNMANVEYRLMLPFLFDVFQ